MAMRSRPRRRPARHGRKGGFLYEAGLNARTAGWLAMRFWRAVRSDIRRARRRRRRVAWR